MNSVSPIKDETWKKVKEIFTEKRLKKGDYFIKDGEMAKQIEFLTNGIIRDFIEIMKEQNIINTSF